MRIALMPCQVVPLSQQVPSSWTASITERVWASWSPAVVAEPHEYLVEHDVVEHLDLRGCSERFAESPRVGAGTLDQFGDAGAAERADRRVHGEAACATRELRVPIQLIARAVGIGVDQVARTDAHRGLVGLWVRAEHDPGVVGSVEPLMSVGRPRVARARPRRPDAAGRGSPRPTAQTRHRCEARHQPVARCRRSPRAGRPSPCSRCPA